MIRSSTPQPLLIAVWVGVALLLLVGIAIAVIALQAMQTQAASPATPTGIAPAASPTPLPTLERRGAWGPLEVGGQVQVGAALPLSQLQQSGMNWVKYQLVYSVDTDPALARLKIDEAREAGLRVLLSIPGPRYPEAVDAGGYLAFVAQVAAYQPDAIEVWNEQNISREWPVGQIDPVRYSDEILEPAYTLIKEISPGTMVISGALAPTGVNDATAMSDDRYLAGMLAAGAADSMDCLGVHHNSGTTSPRTRAGRLEGDHYSWYFLPTLELVYNSFGGALPVCITEVGYLSAEGLGELPPAFPWAADTSVSEQAAWLAEAVTVSRDLGWVRLLIIWNVGFTTWGDDPQAGYSIIRPDGSCPACQALGALRP